MLKLEMQNEKLHMNTCPICGGVLYFNKNWNTWLCESKYCNFPGYKVIRRDPWEKIKKW